MLFGSTPKDVFAYKEEQVRTTNNRLWSIIEGKVEFLKSSYSLEKVRVSTPKPEQFQTNSSNKIRKELHPDSFKTFSLFQLIIKKRFIRKESRKSFAANSKGRSESFHDKPNAVKKFCNDPS